VKIPAPVVPVLLFLIPVGIIAGVLYGLGAISLVALDVVVFGVLVIFVPWAVLKLDPASLTPFEERDN
jgi:hypothetical protein